jgi:hypothetical protein
MSSQFIVPETTGGTDDPTGSAYSIYPIAIGADSTNTYIRGVSNNGTSASSNNYLFFPVYTSSSDKTVYKSTAASYGTTTTGTPTLVSAALATPRTPGHFGLMLCGGQVTSGGYQMFSVLCGPGQPGSGAFIATPTAYQTPALSASLLTRFGYMIMTGAVGTVTYHVYNLAWNQSTSGAVSPSPGAQDFYRTAGFIDAGSVPGLQNPFFFVSAQEKSTFAGTAFDYAGYVLTTYVRTAQNDRVLSIVAYVRNTGNPSFAYDVLQNCLRSCEEPTTGVFFVPTNIYPLTVGTITNAKVLLTNASGVMLMTQITGETNISKAFNFKYAPSEGGAPVVPPNSATVVPLVGSDQTVLYVLWWGRFVGAEAPLNIFYTPNSTSAPTPTWYPNYITAPGGVGTVGFGPVLVSMTGNSAFFLIAGSFSNEICLIKLTSITSASCTTTYVMQPDPFASVAPAARPLFALNAFTKDDGTLMYSITTDVGTFPECTVTTAPITLT